MAGTRTAAWRAWGGVAGWLLLIYGAIPLAPTIRDAVAAHGGRHLFLPATLLMLTAAGVWLVRAAARRGPAVGPLRGLALCSVAALFAVLVWSLRDSAEESLHCVQYAVLGGLLFRALRLHLGGQAVYWGAAMTGIGLGLVDELIQWLVPGRTFDYRDLGFNGLSAVLALAAIAAGLGPGRVPSASSRRDWQTVFHLAAVNLVLLLFCLSNTPELQRRVGRLLPYVATLDEVTAEYGHRHVDAFAGVFRSRLDRAELARQDRERAAEVAAVLDRYAGEERYRAFLARYPAHRDPLLVEARVHLFRRDRYAFLADQTRNNVELRQRHARIAVGENRLLETVFPAVLAHSSYRWPPAMRATLAAWAGPVAAYRSPVSADLITVASRPVLLTLVSCLLVLVLWGGRLVGRGERR